MEVFVKRENWDGGIWMKLPVSQERAEQVMEELAGYHPSRMIPFIGDVKAPVLGLTTLLVGEFVFQDSNLGQLNYLAAKIDSWTAQERAVFETMLQMEKPNSILGLVELMEHFDQYECHPEIKSMDQYGHFLFEQEGRTLPVELSGYFDYETYGDLNMRSNERLTDEGLIVKIEAQRPMTEKKHNTDEIKPGEFVFRTYLAFDNRQVEKNCFYFPMTDEQLGALEEKCRLYEFGEKAEYISNIWELDQFLPLGLTYRELNQIAVEIERLIESEPVSRKKLLASLEAEVPRDAQAVCRIIHNYAEYEFLPIEELTSETYGLYQLKENQIHIEKDLEPYMHLGEYGRKKMLEDGPVETSFGTIINRREPIQDFRESVQEFRLYNSLAVTAYWNERESSAPELLSGEELLSYQDMIRERIEESLERCTEAGLAEFLYHELLKKRVVDMLPGVEEYAGSLWGVLTVRTYGELNDREMEDLMEEWKAMADGGWGEELLNQPIRTDKGNIFIGFWDRDHNEDLFVKTEEEFKVGFQRGIEVG